MEEEYPGERVLATARRPSLCMRVDGPRARPESRVLMTGSGWLRKPGCIPESPCFHATPSPHIPWVTTFCRFYFKTIYLEPDLPSQPRHPCVASSPALFP